jgi:hypothetical protein
MKEHILMKGPDGNYVRVKWTDWLKSGKKPPRPVVRPYEGGWNFSCVIGTRGGGHGKTLIAQIVYEALRESGIEPHLAAIDTDARGSARSTLGLLYPETVELPTAPDMADLAEGHGELALEHWDGLARLLRERNVVLDLGANVIGPMLRWAQIAKPIRVMQGRVVNVLVPVTAHEKSAADALALVAEIEATRACMAIGKIGLVMNEVHGKFEAPGPSAVALRETAAKKGYPVVSLKMGHVKAVEAGMPLGRLRTVDAGTYQRLLGHVNDIPAMRELNFVNAWLDGAVTRLREIGFAPAV